MTEPLEEIVAVLLKDGTRGMLPKSETAGYMRLVGHVLLFNSRGEVLITERVKVVNDGRFDFGVTETVQGMESHQTAALRGLNEELGVAYADMPTLVHICRGDYEEGDFRRRIVTLRCVYDGKFKPNPLEVKNVEWVGLQRAYLEAMDNARQFRSITKLMWIAYANEHLEGMVKETV